MDWCSSKLFLWDLVWVCFFFLFSCVFAYQGHQAHLFICYVKKRGKQVKELSLKKSKPHTVPQRNRDTHSAEVRFQPGTTMRPAGRPPGTNGL